MDNLDGLLRREDGAKDIRDKYSLSRPLWDLGVLDEYADRLEAGI